MTTGGGFVGGGIGVGGAIQGMAVASVLNSITRRTTITTIIEVQVMGRDFVWVTDSITPQQLTILLMPVHAKIREGAIRSRFTVDSSSQ